jgi:type I restriction enzyme M protein
LGSLLASYIDFKHGKLTPSQYVFEINRSNLDSELRINPQRFLPHLNETIEKITKLDGVNGWSVVSLGQISTGTRIFKGPRFNSSRLVVDGPINASCEPYYTPSAVLQENSESVKFLNLQLASKSQLRMIQSIRVYAGDICITRSGSSGRVVHIGKKFDGAIVSDDMIRVRIPEMEFRHYVLYYLQTRFAQDQMSRNEYGAVQQHLEPTHIKEILVPLPGNPLYLSLIAGKAKKAIETRFLLQELTLDVLNAESSLIAAAVEQANSLVTE